MSTIKPRLFRLGYFYWALVPIAIAIAHQTMGEPHFRWSYSWLDQGQGYDPYAARHYTQCNYAGFRHSFTLRPMNGQCPLLMFKHVSSQRSY